LPQGVSTTLLDGEVKPTGVSMLERASRSATWPDVMEPAPKTAPGMIVASLAIIIISCDCLT
jgi:hypothetical protein